MDNQSEHSSNKYSVIMIMNHKSLNEANAVMSLIDTMGMRWEECMMATLQREELEPKASDLIETSPFNT